MLKDNNENVCSADRAPEMRKASLILQRKLANMPVYLKAEIVIPYLKNDCIIIEREKPYFGPLQFLLSGSFISRNIESLFNYFGLKPSHCKSFERYSKVMPMNELA